MMEADPPVAAEVFGLALRELRKKAGLSLRELGKRALYDYTRLSRAEHGEILVPEPQVQALDGILDAGGMLVALRQAAAGDAPTAAGRPCSVTEGEPVTLEIGLPGGGSITLKLSRRQFTQILAAGAVAFALPAAATPDDAERAGRALEQPARVDDEVLGCFRRTLDEFYKADKMLGPGRLIGPVLAQTDVLDGLRASVRPPYADPLFQVLAQHGEMATFLFADPVFA